MRSWLEDTLAAHTGQDREKIHADLERDKILTAARQGLRDRGPGTHLPQDPGLSALLLRRASLPTALPPAPVGAPTVQPVKIKRPNAGSTVPNMAYCGLDTPPCPRRTCRVSP